MKTNAKNTSLIAAFVASACCLPPLILLVFSIGSLAGASFLAKYHWWFLGIGTLLLAAAYAMFFREQKACSADTCGPKNQKLTLISLAFGTCVIFSFALNSFWPMIHPGPSSEELVKIAKQQAPDMETISVPIEGMTCATCSLHVNKVLSDQEGIKDAKASSAKGNAIVTFDPQKITLEKIIDSINTNTGYTASMPVSDSSK